MFVTDFPDYKVLYILPFFVILRTSVLDADIVDIISLPTVLTTNLPFQMRARMAGASMAFSFFCSSMTVLFYTPVANQFGEFVVFYTFAAVTLFGVVYTVLWVPETKGKSLQQIQSYWKEPEPEFV